MRPTDFILNTDFGSTKNDSSGNTISVTIPNNLVYNPNSPILGQATMSAGSISAGLRAIGRTSKYSNRVPGTTLYSDIRVDVPSQPSVPIMTQGLYCVLDRISATTIRLRVGTDGVGGGSPPNFRTREAQTITFDFSTFLSPFDN